MKTAITHSRHLGGRLPGSRPFCLLDFFPKDYVMIIDESHVTIPQLQAMYKADRSRKQTLVWGYRWYSPRMGRWLSRDPIGEVGGLHLYASVQNNPLSRWDYLGWACCTLGEVRNPKVGLTTVRTLGDPNVDKAADDIIDALKDVGTVGDIGDVLKIIAAHVASGGSLTATAIADVLLSKVGLGPDASAKIAANLSDFYRNRGKETQGVHLWSRVCYEECVGGPLSFIFGNSWEKKCDPWKQYQYKKSSVTIDWWASEEDAAAYMKRAYDKALDDFKKEHDLKQKVL